MPGKTLQMFDFEKEYERFLNDDLTLNEQFKLLIPGMQNNVLWSNLIVRNFFFATFTKTCFDSG